MRCSHRCQARHHHDSSDMLMIAHPLAALAAAVAAAVLAALTASRLQQQPSIATWLCIAASLCAEYISLGILYRLVWHPLARYPGPLLAACTDWYTVYWIASGSRHLELHKQHKRHGRHVRYGPNRISINSGAASRVIHDVAGTTWKSDAYGSFRRFFGADMSLTTVDRRAHAFRRRVNASALTPAAVAALEGRVTPHVDYLVADLRRRASTAAAGAAGGDEGWGPGVDMAHSIAYCIADIMGDVTFSQHFDTQRRAENRHFVHDLPKGVAGIHLVGHMQSLFRCDLHKLVFRELIVGVGSLMALSRSFARNRLADRANGVVRDDIWQALLASRDPKTGRAFSDKELVSEASLFIIGGTDGMITATTSTLFYLAHNVDCLHRLTHELRTKFPPVPRTTTSDDNDHRACPIRFASPELQAVPYLLACIDESMRLSPPVPSILPRRVGAGGLVIPSDQDDSDTNKPQQQQHFFPEGTDVGVPHYSLHRDAARFPDPLAFRPERWHTPGAGQAPSYTPFGAGRSSCIGKHMAYQEVSYVVARLLWEFDVRLDPDNRLGEGSGAGDEGRERRDEFQLYCRFVSEQRGPVLQFRRRGDV